MKDVKVSWCGVFVLYQIKILKLVEFLMSFHFWFYHRTIFFRLHVGGYWGDDGSYNGGENRCRRLDFEEPSIAMVKKMVLDAGFSENMSRFSYFPSGVVDGNRMELYDDGDVRMMVRSSQEIESMNLYVVREDDPFLDDVLLGEVEEEEEPQDDGEEYDFYRHDYVESDGSDGDGDGDKIEFYVGQEFVSKEKCKTTIEKYAVREKVNIHFPKSEKKKVQAVCVQDCCKWRLYASINSRSDKMVVRSMEGTHSCYPVGVVDLYSAPKIAADYINEFRTHPKLSAEQIQQRLGTCWASGYKNKVSECPTDYETYYQ